MRHVSIALGMILVLAVGGILAVVATQRPLASVPPTPLARQTGSPTAAAAPSSPTPTSAPGVPTDGPATPAPTAQPPATVVPVPTSAATDAGQSPVPAPSAEISPAPSPTAELPPTAAPTPLAPSREITFTGLGLDSSTSPEETTTARFFSFTVQGPGEIHVRLSETTGRVRACLWRGDRLIVVDEECRTLRRGEIEREVDSDVAEPWTLSLIGADPGASPSTTLHLRFPTDDAAIHLEGFRFQGEANENYNGFVAEINASTDGTIAVVATFDDGQGGAHPYRLVIQEIGGGPAQPYLAESEGQSLDEQTPASTERSYSVSLENRESVADELVLLTADLDWP